MHCSGGELIRTQLGSAGCSQTIFTLLIAKTNKYKTFPHHQQTLSIFNYLNIFGTFSTRWKSYTQLQQSSLVVFATIRMKSNDIIQRFYCETDTRK